MLATLFDFPFEERRKLTRWSDVASNGPRSRASSSRWSSVGPSCWSVCRPLPALAPARGAAEPGNDLISMLAHGEATRDMVNKPMEYLGNLMLLIVGGNDTTRNSISGGVLALNQNPDEYRKLRDNPDLIPNMVSEIIRWQTPLRTCDARRWKTPSWAASDQARRQGGDVVRLRQPRRGRVRHAERVRHRSAQAAPALSFGFGIHRCMGNRLAEMQLRIVWEEILKRFHTVELVGEPVRVRSNFVRGYSDVPVRVHPVQ